ncbi:response regulator [Skermanella mucosa]|uniref:response regulator n=1 Tax=Skermanella mucosa TaxID=1789672 RepID=UPI00192C48DF|nr:response regulator [Skermanella mucosa]UEM18939.1 response regulator [Skermanella mucosa]
MMCRPAYAAESGAGGVERLRRALRVLIVEDEAITAMHIEDMVLQLGHDVIATVDTGHAAVEAARRLRPDVVLMDIRLARGSDGIQAALEIREDPGIRSIFMSAQSDAPTRRRAAAAEPFGYLVKPFAMVQIAEAFSAALAEID